MTSLANHGYEIHREIFTSDEIVFLKNEADRVATEIGSVCVRHLRDRSIIFRELSISEKIHDLLPAKNLRPVRSILFDKTPAENWPVAWHQDLTICTKGEIPTEGYGPWSVKDGVPHVQPPIELLQAMVTARIHLDLTDSTNGALMVIPGSHLHGRIPTSSTAAFTSSHTCECQPGDVLLMSPLILHTSRRSSIPNRRRIIHFEYASSNSLNARLEWHEPY